jgi:hypothetical protein
MSTAARAMATRVAGEQQAMATRVMAMAMTSSITWVMATATRRVGDKRARAGATRAMAMAARVTGKQLQWQQRGQ